ncbi:PAS domain-containing protein [Pelagibius sp. 7325]|uniref:PAS domain-containing protein n=1 Tax=Pelagibius sp. 7325 TaxID=3131994 RepID=UPI0030EED7D8
MTFEQRLHAEALKFLYNYWRQLVRGRLVPSRADIDPGRIAAVLPHIGLFDVESNPRRYRIRLMGTRIVSWYGCDLTGRYLDEIDFGTSDSFTFSVLDQVVDRCVPGYMSGEYTKQDGRVIRYERLYMPLSNDGATVNMVIGAALRLPPEAAITGDCLDLKTPAGSAADSEAATAEA